MCSPSLLHVLIILKYILINLYICVCVCVCVCVYINLIYSVDLSDNPVYIKHEFRQQDKCDWSLGQRGGKC